MAAGAVPPFNPRTASASSASASAADPAAPPPTYEAPEPNALEEHYLNIVTSVISSVAQDGCPIANDLLNNLALRLSTIPTPHLRLWHALHRAGAMGRGLVGRCATEADLAAGSWRQLVWRCDLSACAGTVTSHSLPQIGAELWQPVARRVLPILGEGKIEALKKTEHNPFFYLNQVPPPGTASPTHQACLEGGAAAASAVHALGSVFAFLTDRTTFKSYTNDQFNKFVKPAVSECAGLGRQ